MKIQRTKATYEFYYRENFDSPEQIAGTQTCKQPKATKMWKAIRNRYSVAGIRPLEQKP